INDLRLPGGMGTELVELGGTTPVLIMTSYASLRSAVDALKMGAVDYIAKPFDHEEMLQAVKRILTESQLAQKSPTPKALQQVVNRAYPDSGIIGIFAPMVPLFKQISKLAPTDVIVLILGES